MRLETLAATFFLGLLIALLLGPAPLIVEGLAR